MIWVTFQKEGIHKYPAALEDLNLSCIQTLKKRYNCEVGYSGHEFGLVPTFVAVSMGVTWVERHITLDRTMWGSDHMASIEPGGVIKMTKAIPINMDYRGVSITGKLQLSTKTTDEGFFTFELLGTSAKEANLEFDDPFEEFLF